MSDPGPRPDYNEDHPGDHADEKAALCSELPVAGTGDPVCLIDWGAIERQRLDELKKYFPGVPFYGLDPVAAARYELHSSEVERHLWVREGYQKGKKITLRLNRLKSNGHDSGSPSRGTPNFDVSKRISEKLRAVIADVEERGGQLPSSGGLRPLSYPVNAARSATSFHYGALAVDLFTLSAGLNPTAKLSDSERAAYGREYVDQLVIQKEVSSDRGGFLWKVWCRSTRPDHPDVTMGPIQACQFRDRRGPGQREAVQTSDPFVFEDNVEVHGPFFDLTKIFEAHGFKPIPGRSPWIGNETGQTLSDIDMMEWWHFEISSHLSTSTRFGEMLLEIHEPKALVFSAPWRYRNAKYNGRSFE